MTTTTEALNQLVEELTAHADALRDALAAELPTLDQMRYDPGITRARHAHAVIDAYDSYAKDDR